MEESALLILLKQKDRNALAYLYDHYAAALYSVIKRIVETQQDSEEVLQDSFIKIWNHIYLYDPEKESLFTWMLTIARNLALDQLRSKEFTRKSKTDALENNVSSENATTYVEQKTKDTALTDLLHHLTKKQQMIIHLIYFEGYTHTEVAKGFDIPLGTVKTSLRSALLSLRKLLNISL